MDEQRLSAPDVVDLVVQQLTVMDEMSLAADGVDYSNNHSMIEQMMSTAKELM